MKVSSDEMSVHNGLEKLRLSKRQLVVIKKVFNEILRSANTYQSSKDPTANFLILELKNFHDEYKVVDQIWKTRKVSLESGLKIASLQEGLIKLDLWKRAKRMLITKKINVNDIVKITLQRNGIEVNIIVIRLKFN